MVHYALSEEFRSEFNFMCLDTLIPRAKAGDIIVPPFSGDESPSKAELWLNLFSHWAIQQGLSADHTLLLASTHIKYAVACPLQVATWSDFIQFFFEYFNLEGGQSSILTCAPPFVRFSTLLEKKKAVRFAQWYWRRAATIQCSWFSYRELRSATNFFSELKLVGSGKVAQVFQSFLFDDQRVAVKRYKAVKGHSLEEILYEVFLQRSLPKSDHLVKLIGFSCYEQDPLLVYEYVPNGNLEQHLHGKFSERLAWDERLTIAIDVADAITALHYNSKIAIYHRDVKSTNILLDMSRRAKLADFGIAAAVSHEKQRSYCHTKVKGSRGYTDPHYERTGKLTDTADVYSFGVVLMELVTGLRAGEPSRSKTFLPDLVSEMSVLGLWEETVDSYIWCPCSDSSKLPCKECLKDVIREVVELALKCCSSEPTNRPNISEVSDKLRQIQLEQVQKRMSKMKVAERTDRVRSRRTASWH